MDKTHVEKKEFNEYLTKIKSQFSKIWQHPRILFNSESLMKYTKVLVPCMHFQPTLTFEGDNEDYQ